MLSATVALVQLFYNLFDPFYIAISVVEYGDTIKLWPEQTDAVFENMDSLANDSMTERSFHNSSLNRFIVMLTISSSICVVVPVTPLAMSLLV